MNLLQQLKEITVVVADSGDVNSITVSMFTMFKMLKTFILSSS